MKKLICIECPKGCPLTVDVKAGKVVSISGNKCKKGKGYATSEIEHPMRIVTSTVLAQGLDVKLVPVRTDKAVPKERILEVMEVIKKVKVTQAVACGEVLIENILGLGAHVIATRAVKKQ